MSLIFRKHKPFENLKKYELREHKRCELVLNKTLKQDSNQKSKPKLCWCRIACTARFSFFFSCVECLCAYKLSRGRCRIRVMAQRKSTKRNNIDTQTNTHSNHASMKTSSHQGKRIAKATLLLVFSIFVSAGLLSFLGCFDYVSFESKTP